MVVRVPAFSQGDVGPSLPAEVDLEDEEEDQLGVEPPEDNFTVLTSRNRGHRSSNMSSNSDSSENSGLLRSDKVSRGYMRGKCCRRKNKVTIQK